MKDKLIEQQSKGFDNEKGITVKPIAWRPTNWDRFIFGDGFFKTPKIKKVNLLR